ncbi:hypothetical protein DIPPA_31456 [Diplonema papillatum]|nr:hypothetical protein DIPPA_31456 [Diplonema papillatum]
MAELKALQTAALEELRLQNEASEFVVVGSESGSEFSELEDDPGAVSTDGGSDGDVASFAGGDDDGTDEEGEGKEDEDGNKAEESDSGDGDPEEEGGAPPAAKKVKLERGVAKRANRRTTCLESKGKIVRKFDELVVAVAEREAAKPEATRKNPNSQSREVMSSLRSWAKENVDNGATTIHNRSQVESFRKAVTSSRGSGSLRVKRRMRHRKTLFPLVEACLKVFVVEKRKDNRKVTLQTLKTQAEALLQDDEVSALCRNVRSVSTTYLRNFLSRNRFRVKVVQKQTPFTRDDICAKAQQQQNALQRDAEGLALLEKRLLDLEAGLARREAEVEAAEREIGAAQKRAREQDEAEKEAKRPRGGEELPGEGGVPLMPAELMPGLPRARAEEIFLAFDEQDPGFWAGLGPTLQRELGSLEDEREVLALLDGAAVAGQDVGDDDDDDDFAFLDPERWRTMQPTAANMRGFEDAVRRLYRFKGNQQLQDRRDDVTERVRDLVRLRRGESGPPKRMWILRLGGLFHSYEEQNAEYETRDPSAALVMRDVLRVELLPERVRQARRRFTAQFKAAPKSVPPRARGRGGFAAWERRVAVFEGGATSKKTTAQRASIVASLTRFTAVAGLQAAPPALRIKAFATAMLGKGMTQEQLEAYVARVPGQRGRPRTGEMRTASVGKYVEVLGAKLGVPSGDLAAMKKAILKARLERREVPAHAPPITLEQQRTLVEGLVRGGDEQVTVAACLAWAGALRMADLRALAPTDVVIVGPGLLRVSWWTTKEASLRMRESEVTYRVPLGVALRVSRWVQRGARFTEATTRKLLREARKLFPVCAEHSWKRGALQHLARSGAGWEDLLLMARHQSKDTLKRYLWGCLTPDSVRTARASLLLHTPVSGDLMACSR